MTDPTAAPVATDLPVPPERILARVVAVDPEAAALVGRVPADVTLHPLDFYAGAAHARVVAWLPTGPVAFPFVYHIADDPASDRAHPLGTPERVLAANAAEGFRLSPEQAVAYLRFYLEVTEPAGRAGRRLVAHADEVPWLAKTLTDPGLRVARERAAQRVHGARVEHAGGGLRVTATTLRGRVVRVVTWHVAEDGRVAEERASTVFEGAPVVEVL